MRYKKLQQKLSLHPPPTPRVHQSAWEIQLEAVGTGKGGCAGWGSDKLWQAARANRIKATVCIILSSAERGTVGPEC